MITKKLIEQAERGNIFAAFMLVKEVGRQRMAEKKRRVRRKRE